MSVESWADQRVVALGGGHGLARTLSAFVTLGVSPTAVVTVADDGGSTGRLRRDHGIIAVGDMRRALGTLATDHVTRRLFQHRFNDGDVSGHALGNLILFALITEHGGDVTAALNTAETLLGCHGKVVPCTTADVTLVARIDNDDVLGETAATAHAERVQQIALDPCNPPACPDAVEAIRRADVITLGPGSLFTSVMPNLLVPGIAEALGTTTAQIIYVANLTAQPGETEGMTLEEHVDVIATGLPDDVQFDVVAHSGAPISGGNTVLTPTISHSSVRSLHVSDLALRRADSSVVAAHDETALATAITEVVRERRESDT